MIYRGEIESIGGQPMSGLLTMVIGGHVVHADNGPTIRALDAAFGGVIGAGHSFNSDAVIGKEVYWVFDDMGLTLGGFCPVDSASDELIEAFESQEQE